MIVFIVEELFIDRYCGHFFRILKGIFSNRELAQKYIDNQNKYREFEIKEFEVI